MVLKQILIARNDLNLKENLKSENRIYKLAESRKAKPSLNHSKPSISSRKLDLEVISMLKQETFELKTQVDVLRKELQECYAEGDAKQTRLLGEKQELERINISINRGSKKGLDIEDYELSIRR